MLSATLWYLRDASSFDKMFVFIASRKWQFGSGWLKKFVYVYLWNQEVSKNFDGKSAASVAANVLEAPVTSQL